MSDHLISFRRFRFKAKANEYGLSRGPFRILDVRNLVSVLPVWLLRGSYFCVFRSKK